MAGLAEAFAEASRSHFRATMEGDYKAANRAADRVHRTFQKLTARGEEGREALIALAESGADAASVMAAVYSLKYATERSLRLLERFAKDAGILGLQAGQAIQRWKSGEWRLE